VRHPLLCVYQRQQHPNNRRSAGMQLFKTKRKESKETHKEISRDDGANWWLAAMSVHA
jgi:hypothetical protein